MYPISVNEGASFQPLSQALDGFPEGVGGVPLNISPDGEWMVLEIERFGCADLACPAVLKGNLAHLEAVVAGGAKNQ